VKRESLAKGQTGEQVMTALYCVRAFVLLVLLLASSLVWAEQPEQIEKTIGDAIETRKESQKKADEWQGKKERLKARYYQLKDAMETAQIEVGHMQEVVKRQEAYVARMQKRIVEMEKIRQRLVPYLEEVIAEMEKAVERDLPFLTEERTARIRALKELVHDPELSSGEKIRRVFEALRVEMDYGKSVETTKEEITFQGQKLLVRVLRVGRTALLMETLDEKDAGLYNGREWVPLPGKYKSEIKKAIEITDRRRPIEFVNLPLREGAQ
jgi:hypothetical protein